MKKLTLLVVLAFFCNAKAAVLDDVCLNNIELAKAYATDINAPVTLNELRDVLHIYSIKTQMMKKAKGQQKVRLRAELRDDWDWVLDIYGNLSEEISETDMQKVGKACSILK